MSMPPSICPTLTNWLQRRADSKEATDCGRRIAAATCDRLAARWLDPVQKDVAIYLEAKAAAQAARPPQNPSDFLQTLIKLQSNFSKDT